MSSIALNEIVNETAETVTFGLGEINVLRIESNSSDANNTFTCNTVNDSFRKIIFLKCEQESVLISSFVFEGKSHTIYPPVEFDTHFDMETEFVELIGRGSYSDALVYGSDLKEALQILREEYLPILWEDCLNADNIKMTKRLRTMVNDFKDRVQANDTEGKGSKKWIKTKGI